MQSLFANPVEHLELLRLHGQSLKDAVASFRTKPIEEQHAILNQLGVQTVVDGKHRYDRAVAYQRALTGNKLNAD